MKQENEKLISGEMQPEEPTTPGSNGRTIVDAMIEQNGTRSTEQAINQDFIKNGAAIQESFGSNSTFEVNLHKGNLFFTQHLFTAQGNHLPANFAVSYNQRFASSNYTTDGKPLLFIGWKLNYQQFIRFADDKCVYVDGAFKEHVFEKSTFDENIYLDVSAQSGAILRPANTDELSFADYVITDGANTDLFFKDNRLVKIRQTRGSTPVETTITYDALNRVTQVTDGLGNNYAVNYLTNAVTITDANGTVLATLTADSNNCLASVDYYEDTDSGKVCQFTYYPSTCLLSNVRDQFAQEKAIFAYYSDSKFGTMGRYVIKGETSTQVQSKTITYNSGHAIVAQSNGSTSADAQIRYKYSFDADGVLLDAHEIDQDDQPIGLQPYRPEVEDEANNPIYDIKNKKDLLNGVAVDCPAHSMEGSAMQILNADLIVPSYKGSAYLFLSWDLDINTGEAISPTGTIVCEAFANGRSIGGVLCDCANDTSYSGFCVAKELMPNTTTTVTLKMTHSGNTFPITLSNVRAWFAPVTRNEVRINITPSSAAGSDPYCITETLGSMQQHWFQIGQVPFDTNLGRVVPETFTVADYQNTMFSYFKDPTSFNLFYNDCKNVVCGVSSLTVEKMGQTLTFDDSLFAVVQTSMTGQTTITHFTPENSKLNIHTRQLNDTSDFAYKKLDNYLRTTSEWQAGSAITTYEYDTFGNVKESYFGGSTGIRDTSTYSTNGQQVVESPDYIYTDTHTTAYEYNDDGLVSQITTPINQEINFDYQNKNLLSRVSAVVANQTNANDITYDGSLITSLSHNDTTFQFTYDGRNNISQVTVAGATLLSKSAVYNTNGSFVTQSTYSNQQVVKKHYDKYGRIIKISDATSDESVLAKFIYSDEEVATDITEPTDNRLVISGSSKLRVVIDATANTRTDYSYDGFGQLCKVQNQNITTTQTLDDYDRVAQVQQSLGSGGNMATNYTYASPTDNTLASETTNWDMPGEISTTYSRDNLQRPTETTVMVGNNGHKYAYSYVPRQEEVWVEDGFGPIIRPDSVGTNAVTPPSLGGHWEVRNIGTTPYISSFKEYSMSGTTATLVRTDSIEYDANGNIIQYGNVTYEYDGLNRLVRENNPGIDKTTIWQYNTSGNITSKSEYAYTTSASPTGGTTTAFIYGTSWKDQLSVISVGTTAKQITYDQAGNPTNYKGATFTWTRGRLLASYTPSGSTVQRTLKYDANGIRCEKNTRAFGQDNITVYVYNGNNLIREYRVNEPSSQKTFLYNSQGVIGFVYQGVTYTYRKNLFGDIVAIYNGSTKVAEYKYDAWGNQKIMDGNSNVTNDLTHIANVNPFRYRGYYWENDIQLYYLMSRYYDPQIGRFVNADTLDYLDPETLGGLNLYAYCLNNPVMYTDPLGTDSKWWEWALLGLAIVASIAAIVAGMVWPVSTFAGTLALAALSGAGTGFLIGASSNIYSQVKSFGIENMDPMEALASGGRDAAIGAVTGLFSAGFAEGFRVIGSSLGQMVGFDFANSILSRTLGLGVGFYTFIGTAAGAILGAAIGTEIATAAFGDEINGKDILSGSITDYIQELLMDLLK